jgi:hypothetical protein
MEILRRLGTFFILVGLVLLILFAGSVMSKDAKTSYLLAGVVTFLVGLLLKGKKQPSDSGRFSAIRRASAATRQRREEKLNQRQKK